MSRVFSLAWLLAFTKSFAWLVCCVVGLFTPRKKPLQQAACDFRWACSSDTSKILGVDTWLTGFETGFNQLNNSRVLIFYSFDVQTGARVILPPVCRVSTKRIEDFQSTELFQNQVFDFLSVLGVVFFVNGEDASVSLVTVHGKFIYIPSRCSICFETTWNSITILQNPVFLSIFNN